MTLSELFLDRFLYRDNKQTLLTKDSEFVSADSTTPAAAAIPSGGAAQDINTGNVTINGNQLTPGTIPQATLDISNWGWGQTCAFLSTNASTVSWGNGFFTSASGTNYSILGGNTGTMSQKVYIYFDLNVSNNTYHITTNAGSSVGIGKVLVAVANPGSPSATYNLSQASQIVGDNILANTIDASKITTGQLVVGTNVGLGSAFPAASAGTLATMDMIGAAELDSTVIVGGYIKTSLLTANNIQTGTLNAINITGSTITGSTLQTGTTGFNVNIGSDHIELRNGTSPVGYWRQETMGDSYGTFTTQVVNGPTVNSSSVQNIGSQLQVTGNPLLLFGQTGVINITSHLYPTSSGTYNLGNGTYYWNDVSYKTLTDRGCLGWFDEGVELQDGTIVSDMEAIQAIKKHPTKKTIYGKEMLDYTTFPKVSYKKATKEDGTELPRDENNEPYDIIKDEKGLESIITAQDGIEMTSIFSIMIGALKELDNRVKALENKVNQ